MAGVGMVVGPLVGGLLAQHASWRWIFYVNLPLGAVSLGIGATMLRLPDHTRKHRIDYPGAALVAAAAVALLLITEWGGKTYAWGSPEILALIGLDAVLIGLFLWRQRVAAEPILPLSLFRNPTLRTAIPIQALLGVTMTGAIVYVMVYLQVVRHITPTRAGLYLIPMAVGMTASGLIASRLMVRGWSIKRFVAGGAAFGTAGAALLGFLRADSPAWWIWLALLVFGAGLGQLLGQLIVVCQQAVAPHQLGVTTTAVRFGQTLGGAFGAALFGTVLSRLYTARAPGGVPLDAATPARLPAAVDAFVSSLDVVFFLGAGVMALAFLLALALRMPEQAPAAAEDAVPVA
jgi:predicted MFS family arabinose efflux permease